MEYLYWFVLACCVLFSHGQSPQQTPPPCLFASESGVCSGKGVRQDCSDRGLTDIPCQYPCQTQVIYLNQNSISMLYRDAFSPKTQCLLQNLEILDLSDNSISNIPDSVFKYLENLASLSLARNRLTRLQPRTFENLRLSSTLTTLDLSSNQLTELSQEIFGGIQSLKYLLLGDNLLLDVGVALRDLQILKTIDLSHNRIANLSHQAFVGNSKLEEIELSGNELTEVPHAIAESNSNLRGSLLYLGLKSNQIVRVDSKGFGSFTYLARVDLSSNDLESVGPNTFINLPELNNLKLNGNSLTTMHKSAIDGNRKLTNLYLFDNPWICDCDVIELWRHLNRSTVYVNSPSAVICQIPGTRDKRKLLDVSMNRGYDCRGPSMGLSQTHIIIIAAGGGAVLLFVIIALVIVIIKGKRKSKNEPPQNVPLDDGLYLAPSVAGSQSNMSREESHKYDVPFPMHNMNDMPSQEPPATPPKTNKLYKPRSNQQISNDYEDADGYMKADDIL